MKARERPAKVAISMINPRRPNLTLRDFFLYEQRMVAEAQINSFFKRLIYTLIVLNVILGVPTIYYEYIHEETPIVTRSISQLYPNEI